MRSGQSTRYAAGLLAWMFAFTLVVVGVCSLAPLLRRSPGTLAVRRDLASWLETMATVRGESSSEIADRAISRYRASLDE